MSNNRATLDALGDLHAVVAQVLTERLQSGEATVGDVANAIRFLKDNGIEAVLEDSDKLKQIMESLPDFDNQDDLTTIQ